MFLTIDCDLITSLFTERGEILTEGEHKKIISN